MTEPTVRERIFPQMRAYDAMPAGRIVPFAMLAGPAELRSATINTDRFGFRWTRSSHGVRTAEGIRGMRDVSVIVGGSTVFGVGATADDQTIASMLDESMGTPWLNFGIRGGVSFQEVIHTLRFVHEPASVRALVLFSGVNDTYINLLHEHTGEFDRRFEEQDSILGFFHWRRQALSSLLSRFYGTSAESLVGLPLRDMLLYPIRRPAPPPPPPRLSAEERIERLHQLTRRNALVYAALAKQLGCQPLYVLQPFLSWTGKTQSADERAVMQFLLDSQAGTAWRESYELMKRPETYAAIREALRGAMEEYGIPFVDANPAFNTDETLFVDHVHLNDAGHRIAAHLIERHLK